MDTSVTTNSTSITGIDRNIRVLAALTLALLVSAASVSADTYGTYTGGLTSDSDMNFLFLFGDIDADEYAHLNDVAGVGPDFPAWNVDLLGSSTPQGNSAAVFYGATQTAGADYDVTFQYRNDDSAVTKNGQFAWLEVLFDSDTNTYTSNYGEQHYDEDKDKWKFVTANKFNWDEANARVWVDSNYNLAAAAPVPLPPALALMFPALAYLGFKRRNASAAA